MKNDSEIIKCLLNQIDAMKKLFENEIVLARMEIRTIMDRHVINHHDRNIVPGSDNYLELFKKKETEVWKLREKLDDSSKRLDDLIKANDDQSKPPLTGDTITEPQFLSELVPFGTLPQ